MKNPHLDQVSTDVARLLRALANLIDSSDIAGAAAFIETHASVSKIKRRASLDESRSLLGGKGATARDLPALAVTLHGLSSRDEGHAFLTSASLMRRELEDLGRLLKIPVSKTDNVERLAEKIIEESIGSRLSSEAIRGERFK